MRRDKRWQNVRTSAKLATAKVPATAHVAAGGRHVWAAIAALAGCLLRHRLRRMLLLHLLHLDLLQLLLLHLRTVRR